MTLSQMWDIPPGVPTVIQPPEAPAEPAPPSVAPDTPPTVAQKKKWTLLPEKMLGPLARSRAQHVDPFLADYPKHDPAAAALADARRNAELQRGAIPLPSTKPVADVPAVTDAFGNPQDKKDPLAIAGADHQAGPHANVVGAFNSLDRLRAAIDADSRHTDGKTDGAESLSPARDQVDKLMRQARRDYDEGQLAAALRSAQQANALALELKLEFDEADESPMVLVELIREKLASDVSDVAALPPEESVASGAELDPPNFRSPDPAAGERAVDDASGHARLESTISDVDPPGDAERRAATRDVEVLPPSPEELEPGPVVPAPTAGEQRDVAPTRELATVVGPHTRLDQTARVFSPSMEPAPADEATTDEMEGASGTFWPKTEPANDESDETPAAQTAAESSEPVAAPQAAPRNVSWRESAQPLVRIDVKTIPQPAIVALVIATVWFGGFVAMRGYGFARSLVRRAKG